jgi:hypothetical protein
MEKIQQEKQIADYLNMMAAPISKEYTAEITRIYGNDLIFFVYRNKCYSAFLDKTGNVKTKSIRVEPYGD